MEADELVSLRYLYCLCPSAFVAPVCSHGGTLARLAVVVQAEAEVGLTRPVLRVLSLDPHRHLGDVLPRDVVHCLQRVTIDVASEERR